MIINKISNINFRNTQAVQPKDIMESHNAILMLRDPNASVKFQHNQEIAQNADTLNSNPLKALGYKLYRTFSLLTSDDTELETEATDEKKLDTLA